GVAVGVAVGVGVGGAVGGGVGVAGQLPTPTAHHAVATVLYCELSEPKSEEAAFNVAVRAPEKFVPLVIYCVSARYQIFPPAVAPAPLTVTPDCGCVPPATTR